MQGTLNTKIFLHYAVVFGNSHSQNCIKMNYCSLKHLCPSVCNDRLLSKQLLSFPSPQPGLGGWMLYLSCSIHEGGVQIKVPAQTQAPQLAGTSAVSSACSASAMMALRPAPVPPLWCCTMGFSFSD